VYIWCGRLHRNPLSKPHKGGKLLIKKKKTKTKKKITLLIHIWELNGLNSGHDSDYSDFL
jgi:hypothetical protein